MELPFCGVSGGERVVCGDSAGDSLSTDKARREGGAGGGEDPVDSPADFRGVCVQVGVNKLVVAGQDVASGAAIGRGDGHTRDGWSGVRDEDFWCSLRCTSRCGSVPGGTFCGYGVALNEVGRIQGLAGCRGLPVDKPLGDASGGVAVQVAPTGQRYSEVLGRTQGAGYGHDGAASDGWGAVLDDGGRGALRGTLC